MRNAAKVFIWIGIVLQFFLIYPSVIGILALQKINTANSSKELQNWAIATIFLCSPVGGILMLNIKDNELGYINSQPTKLLSQIKEVVGTEERPILTIKVLKIIQKIILGLALLSLLTLVLSIFQSLYELIEVYDWTTEYYYARTYAFTTIFLSCIQIPLVMGGVAIFRIGKTFSNILFIIASTAGLVVALALLYNDLNYLYHLDEFHYTYFLVLLITNLIILGILTLSAITILILSKKTRKVKIKVEKTINNMECELNEVHTMFEHSVITQEEYDQIRKSIIAKYYK